MISYEFEIVLVDEAARVMEVLYTVEGKPPHRVGARLPYDGESVEAVVAMYSPAALWLEQEQVVIVPPVGTRGSLSYGVKESALLADELANVQMFAEIEYERRIAKALVKFGVLNSDPTEISTTTL